MRSMLAALFGLVRRHLPMLALAAAAFISGFAAGWKWQARNVAMTEMELAAARLDLQAAKERQRLLQASADALSLSVSEARENALQYAQALDAVQSLAAKPPQANPSHAKPVPKPAGTGNDSALTEALNAW